MRKCVYCGEREESAKVAKVYEYNGYTLTIKNIPCYRCANCGEISFSSKVAARIDAVFKAWKSAVKGDMIADYEDAA